MLVNGTKSSRSFQKKIEKQCKRDPVWVPVTKSSSGSEVAGEKWRDASCKKLPSLSEMRVNSLDNNGGTGRVRWQLLGGSSPCWFWSFRRKKREYQLKDIGGLSHGVCVGL